MSQGPGKSESDSTHYSRVETAGDYDQTPESTEISALKASGLKHENRDGRITKPMSFPPQGIPCTSDNIECCDVVRTAQTRMAIRSRLWLIGNIYNCDPATGQVLNFPRISILTRSLELNCSTAAQQQAQEHMF